MNYFATAVDLARAADQEIRERLIPRHCESCAHLAYPIESDRSDVQIYRCPKGHLTLVATGTEE